MDQAAGCWSDFMGGWYHQGDVIGQTSRSLWGTGMRQPGRREIQDTERQMVERQQRFRLAAERVAAEFAKIDAVERVALFGSVAAPLEREVPRFRQFCRARVEVWHECKDVDVAIWLCDLSALRDLQKARSRAVTGLWRERQIGVAQHQVDVFILEPVTDRYLGRLCDFASCPKDGKRECLVPTCGQPPHLQQHEGFALSPDALQSDEAVVLFDRSLGSVAAHGERGAQSGRRTDAWDQSEE